MSKLRKLVVIVIIGLSALVVLDNATSRQPIQSGKITHSGN